MTPVRLLTVAVLLCTASAFAQEQLSSTTRPTQTTEKSGRVTASDPLRILLDQSTDSRASSFQWQQLDPISVSADARPGDDTLCYKIRSYVVARDSKDSESVHPVGYSTCQPASRYRLKRAQIQTDSSAR